MATEILGIGTDYQTLSIYANHYKLEVGYNIPHVDMNSNVTPLSSIELTLLDRFCGDSMTIYLDQEEIKHLITHLQSQLK